MEESFKIFLILLHPFFPTKHLSDTNHRTHLLDLRSVFAHVFTGGAETRTLKALFPADELALRQSIGRYDVSEVEVDGKVKPLQAGDAPAGKNG